MNISRRGLLVASSALVPAALLAGCATGSGGVTFAQVLADVQNAVPALQNALGAVLKAAPAALPAATVTQIDGYLSSASGVLAQLSGSMTATQAAPLVQKVESDLNAVISAAAAIPLIPPPFSTALAAAAIVLPIVEGFVNATLNLPAKVAASPARARMAALSPMSVSAAEATLAAMAR